LSDIDDADELFRQMFRLMEQLMVGQSSRVRTPATEAADRRDDELIEGDDEVTYLLHLPSEEGEPTEVSVSEDAIEVTGSGMHKKRSLPSRVDPKSAKKEFRNGILSVRMRKVN